MYQTPIYNQNDRIGFVVPFLAGALTGGAAVGLTRPRPYYNNYQPYPPFNPAYPYANYNYSYYVPYYR